MSFTTDATSGIGIPQNSTEWGDPAISPYLDVPDHLWLCQEASNTSLADSIGSVTWTKASNSMLWRQAIGGWSQLGILISALSGGTINGFTSSAAALHPTNQSVMYMWYIKWNGTPSTQSTIMQLGGTVGASQSILRILTQPTSRVSVGVANLVETTGADDPNAYSANGGVQPVVIQYDRTNGLYRVFLGQEVINTTYYAADGTTTKSIGSINSTPCGPFYILYGCMWAGAKAEKADWQIRGGLDALHWLATSTPFFPVTFTASLVTSGMSIGDRLDAAAMYVPSPTETVTLSESLLAQLQDAIVPTDSLSTGGSLAIEFDAVQSLTDNPTTTDALVSAFQPNANVAESFSTAAAMGGVAAYQANVDAVDSPNIAEQVSAQWSTFAAVVDNLVTVDFINVVQSSTQFTANLQYENFVAAAFTVDFPTASMTPISFDLIHIPQVTNVKISVQVKMQARDETLIALDFDQTWRWPFDILGPNNNSIGPLTPEPVHVTLLPRAGWPPGAVEVKIAAAFKATPA